MEAEHPTKRYGITTLYHFTDLKEPGAHVYPVT